MKRSELTKKMRWEIADKLAEDRLPLINSLEKCVNCRSTIYTRYIKRVIDSVVSLVALIITLPVLNNRHYYFF